MDVADLATLPSSQYSIAFIVSLCVSWLNLFHMIIFTDLKSMIGQFFFHFSYPYLFRRWNVEYYFSPASQLALCVLAREMHKGDMMFVYFLSAVRAYCDLYMIILLCRVINKILCLYVWNLISPSISLVPLASFPLNLLW